MKLGTHFLQRGSRKRNFSYFPGSFQTKTLLYREFGRWPKRLDRRLHRVGLRHRLPQLHGQFGQHQLIEADAFLFGFALAGRVERLREPDHEPAALFRRRAGWRTGLLHPLFEQRPPAATSRLTRSRSGTLLNMASAVAASCCLRRGKLGGRRGIPLCQALPRRCTLWVSLLPSAMDSCNAAGTSCGSRSARGNIHPSFMPRPIHSHC